jgi:probable blue pigment (indigoidine) exporter
MNKFSANFVAWGDILITALAPVIWGSTYIITTQFLPPDRPFTAALIRVLPAGILLLLMTRRLPQFSAWPRLLLLSALNIGFFQALLFVAAYRLPGGLAAVVGALQPLLMIVLVWVFDQRKPGMPVIFAAITGVLGMAALLLGPGSVWDPVGIAAALSGTACMAVGTYLSRRWNIALPVLAFTGWQLLLGGLILLPLACLFDPPLPVLTPVNLAGYAYLCVIGALFAYVLWFRGVARLPAVAISSLGLFSPLTAVLLGWIFLGQTIRGLSLAGLLMVLLSILAVQWLSKPAASKK